MNALQALATGEPRDYSVSRVHRLDLTAPQRVAVEKVAARGSDIVTTADVRSWVMLKQIVARGQAEVLHREGHPKFGKITAIRMK